MNNLERLAAEITAEVARWDTDPILPTLVLVGAAGQALLDALERAAQPLATAPVARGRSGLHVPVDGGEFLVSVTSTGVQIEQMGGVYEAGRGIPIATADHTVQTPWDVHQQVNRVLDTYPEDYPEDGRHDDDGGDDWGEDPDTIWEQSA